MECDRIVSWTSEVAHLPLNLNWREPDRRVKVERIERKRTRAKEATVTTTDEARPDEARPVKVGRTTGRHGQCGQCGETKWLLNKKPPLCNPCWRAKNPEAVEAASVKQKASRKARAKKEESKKPEPVLDEIGLEMRALEQIARALESLPSAAAERVMRYAASRYGSTSALRLTTQQDEQP